MILLRRPTFSYVGTLWFILYSIQFTYFGFTYCSILSLFTINKEAWLSKISEDFRSTSKRHSNKKYFRKIQSSNFIKEKSIVFKPFYFYLQKYVSKKDIFQSNLVWKVNNKRHKPNKSSHKERFEQVEMLVDLPLAPTLTVIKQPPRNVMWFFQEANLPRISRPQITSFSLIFHFPSL